MRSFKEWLNVAGVFAGLVVAAVEVAQFISTARTTLTISYQPMPFAIPMRLQERGALDTVALNLYKTSTRLYYAYYDHLTPAERLQIPDSLRRPALPDAYFFGGKTAPFARSYGSFGTLHIQNDGDKALGALQVLHKRAAYYEYKDSAGHLQSGESASRFPVGELVGGESRDIKIWTTDYSIDRLTVSYTDGKTEAPLTETVSGAWAWLARNADFFRIIALLLAAYALVIGVWYLWVRITRSGQGKQADPPEE